MSRLAPKATPDPAWGPAPAYGSGRRRFASHSGLAAWARGRRLSPATPPWRPAVSILLSVRMTSLYPLIPETALEAGLLACGAMHLGLQDPGLDRASVAGLIQMNIKVGCHGGITMDLAWHWRSDSRLLLVMAAMLAGRITKLDEA